MVWWDWALKCGMQRATKNLVQLMYCKQHILFAAVFCCLFLEHNQNPFVHTVYTYVYIHVCIISSLCNAYNQFGRSINTCKYGHVLMLQQTHYVAVLSRGASCHSRSLKGMKLGRNHGAWAWQLYHSRPGLMGEVRASHAFRWWW